VAQPKMEWWLNHVGQMAQSVQDYSNSANLLVTFMIMIMFRMFFHAILHLQKIFIQHIH
jgi:hypothetical protein